MSAVSAERRTRTTTLLRGDPDVITSGLISAAVMFHWARRERGYVVPTHLVDRVLVAIESAGHRVELSEQLW